MEEAWRTHHLLAPTAVAAAKLPLTARLVAPGAVPAIMAGTAMMFSALLDGALFVWGKVAATQPALPGTRLSACTSSAATVAAVAEGSPTE